MSFIHCWKSFNGFLNFFYFNEVTVRGPRPSQSTPMLVCVTHWTGIVDTQLSFVTNTRPSRLVAKDTLVNSGVLGPIARAALVIPVYRKQDHQVPETAATSGESLTSQTTVSDTAVPSEHPSQEQNHRACCMGPDSGSMLSVETPAADSEAPAADSAAALLDANEGPDTTPSSESTVAAEKGKNGRTESKNKSSFSAVYEALGGPGPLNTITMMPEGVSHDHPHMMDLKVGAALWAMGTLELYPDCGIQVVCVGVESLAKTCVRTHFHVEWGEAFSVPADLMTSFMENSHLGRDNPAPGLFMELIAQEFKKVCLQAPDDETKARAHLARKLFQPDKLSMSTLDRYQSCEYWRCARDFVEITETHSDKSDVVKMQTALIEYEEALQTDNVSDAVVVRCTGGAACGVMFGTYFLIASLLSALIFTVPGLLLSPFILIATAATNKFVAGDVAKNIKRTGNVGYKADDVWLTYFYTFAYPLVPLCFLIYSIIAAVFLDQTPDESAPWGVIWWLVCFFVLPLLVLAVAVLAFDATLQCWSACVAHLSTLGMSARLAELREQRCAVKLSVREILIKYADKSRLLSDEYHQVRSLSGIGVDLWAERDQGVAARA